jgi:predicted phage tail protein
VQFQHVNSKSGISIILNSARDESSLPNLSAPFSYILDFTIAPLARAASKGVVVLVVLFSNMVGSKLFVAASLLGNVVSMFRLARAMPTDSRSRREGSSFSARASRVMGRRRLLARSRSARDVRDSNADNGANSEAWTSVGARAEGDAVASYYHRNIAGSSRVSNSADRADSRRSRSGSGSSRGILPRTRSFPRGRVHPTNGDPDMTHAHSSRTRANSLLSHDDRSAGHNSGSDQFHTPDSRASRGGSVDTWEMADQVIAQSAFDDDSEDEAEDGGTVCDTYPPRSALSRTLISEPPAGKAPTAALPPEHFQCSITLEIMRDPVTTSDGMTFERMAIESWLKSHDTSPLTNLKLANKNLVPNRSLKLKKY